MAEFGSSGIPDLPSITADTLGRTDSRVLGWLREAVEDGDRLIRSDPMYDRYEQVQRYITGDLKSDPDADLITWLPQPSCNEFGKAAKGRISALTDIKPLFGFRSKNPKFQFQADLLNNYIIHWWMTTSADMALGDTILYALAGGGDLKIEWNPAFGVYDGDTVLLPSDPRDTLPFRPSSQRDPQLWSGVTFREEHTINALRAKYSTAQHLFIPSTDTVLASVIGRFRTVVRRLMTPMTDTLSGLGREVHTRKAASGGVVLYRTYLDDRTTNLTSKDLPMGLPGSAWAYTVKPGAHLYPRKRLIVWTEHGIVFDGPNPYWHGLYPFSRLQLWDVPWQFLGIGPFADLIPLQDAISATLTDLRLGLKQWMDQQVEFDVEATDRNFEKVFDSRRPGAKIKRVGGLSGEAVKKLNGPEPLVLQLALELFRELRNTFRDLSGTANLQALLQLRQVPSGDTVQQYMNALTPELRYEGRKIEVFLRDLATQVKVNLFQFVTKTRRAAVLGDAGVALEDFDFDPDTIVPAMSPTRQTLDPTGTPTEEPDPDYLPDLDVGRSRDERAQFFQKLLVFYVAPNSLLNINAMEQKMTRLQLARMGYYDFWSLGESLEIPNIGTPPPIPLPPLKPIDPMEIQQLILADPTGQMLKAKYTIDPTTGQFLEIRVPQTVTERLIAQQLLGIGMTENPAGRKASGQEAPKLESKDGGSRQTVTESPS